MTTKIVRTKQAGQAWETTVEPTGGGGGGDDLAAVLSNGNDAGAQQITNLADGSADTDGATVGQVNGAYALTLADILGNGDSADNFQVKGIADGTDPQDAVNLQQLESASVPGLAAVLAESEDAGGHDIQTVANLQAETINVTGGDDSGPVAKIVPPVGAVNNVAEIGPQNLGLIVGPDGSVQSHADDGVATSLVAMQRGAVATWIDTDGTHMVGLPITDPHIVGVLWQDVDVVKVSLGP